MTFRFGRIPSKFDARDWNLRNFIPLGAKLSLEGVGSVSWLYPSMALEQGDTNHCGGFSMANFGINEPTHTPQNNEDGHNFYYICKEIDEQPLNEDGTSMRSVAKALQQLGRVENYAFAYDLASIKWWLLNRGPLLVGTIWTTDMLIPNSNNIVTIGGGIEGGHAYLINEWREDDYIGIQNSWGERWGINGKAYISALNFEKILKVGGEAVTAVEIEEIVLEEEESESKPVEIEVIEPLPAPEPDPIPVEPEYYKKPDPIAEIIRMIIAFIMKLFGRK